MILEIIGSITLLVYLIYLYSSRHWNYWSDRNIPYMKPVPFLGCLKSIMLGKLDFITFDRSVHDYFKGHKLGGYFELSSPVLWILDPELIKLVLVKDFDHFINRKKVGFEHDPIFRSMVSGSRDQYWREIRSFNSPTFSSGKMKKMFQSMTSCGDVCVSHLKELAKSGKAVEMKDIFGKLTIDVVAASAYGLQVDSFNDPDTTFARMASKLLSPTYKQYLTVFCFMFAPPLAKYLNFGVSDPDAVEFFRDVTISTVERREKNNIRGNDFLQLLSDARKGELVKEENEEDEEATQILTGKTKMELSDLELTAQGLQFFSAGYETIANLLSFIAYELAVHQDVQDKLREEVMQVLEKHREFSYDAVKEMQYMDMVVSEVQRLFPALSRIDRECVKNYRVPGTEFVIEKGMTIAVNIAGLHYDSEYFPDPEKFDPERFRKEQVSKRSPYVFLPFGTGPRHCIGMRFALMQVKSALAKLLSSIRLNICDKTVVPVQVLTFNPITKPKDGVWLQFETL